LHEADLRGADLENIYYDYRTAGIQRAPEGDLIAWKKCKDEHIITLLIPKEARRSCATTRKFRSEYVIVLDAPEEGAKTQHGTIETIYRKGETVYADSWDEDRWKECSHGIHWFLSHEEAEQWEKIV
jgi:hypothetical protein